VVKALDLCCLAGGATKGLQRAGFHVTGVDLVRSPRYCGDAFIQADALEVDLSGYDFIWASPPCQRYSLFSRNLGTAANHPDLIAPMRARLQASGALWCIENVPGAPLRASFVLCGTMFSLPLIRHRLFETSFTPQLELLPACVHMGDEIPVYGNGTSRWHLQRFGRGVTLAEKRMAMGIDWMNRDELSQAIPPVYAEFIGRAAMRALREVAA
jgi:DNA (cytosine-5)-methyltransferase 1